MNTRRLFVGLWLTVTLVFWAAATPLFADNRGVVVAVESIGMTVLDMDRSVAFYSDVLTFKPISDVSAPEVLARRISRRGHLLWPSRPGRARSDPTGNPLLD